MTFYSGYDGLPEPWRSLAKLEETKDLLRCIATSTSLSDRQKESMMNRLVPSIKLREKILREASGVDESTGQAISFSVLVREKPGSAELNSLRKKTSWWKKILAWCTKKRTR